MRRVFLAKLVFFSAGQESSPEVSLTKLQTLAILILSYLPVYYIFPDQNFICISSIVVLYVPSITPPLTLIILTIFNEK
jgi:hypothetical protein